MSRFPESKKTTKRTYMEKEHDLMVTTEVARSARQNRVLRRLKRLRLQTYWSSTNVPTNGLPKKNGISNECVMRLR